MFSVVIPVYNGAKFIDDALQCVFKQTFPDWEAIVVDDGSTDETAQVLEKYKDIPKVHVHTQKNSGASAARNKGMSLAKHDYITFLDVDDLWYENHLEVIYDMIQKYPQAGMYATTAENRMADGSVVKDCRYFKDKPDTVFLEDFFEAYAMDKSAKMYNTNSICVTKEAAVKSGGYPVGCRIGEDLEFNLKVSAYYSVVLTKRVTTVYQKANSTATKDVSFDPNWHFFEEVEKIYHDESISCEKRANIKKVMDWFTIRRCRHYIIDDDKKSAWKAFFTKTHRSLWKDKLINFVLLLMPVKAVKKIFAVRWRSRA